MWWKTKQERTVRVGVRSDVGQVRTENQDAWGIVPELDRPAPVPERLFIVADGMGGHEHGQDASRMAVAALSERYFQDIDPSVPNRLRNAFAYANTRIRERATNGGQVEKMGTTCTALLVRDEELYLAHVGDSRCYRLTQEGIEQISQDHTFVEQMRLEGVLTEEEARNHPRRHALLRALGIRDEMDVDVQGPWPLTTHVRYLLCSDGIAPLSDAELHRMVMDTNQPQEACDALVDLVNERGAPDNVTVMIVSF